MFQDHAGTTVHRVVGESTTGERVREVWRNMSDASATRTAEAWYEAGEDAGVPVRVLSLSRVEVPADYPFRAPKYTHLWGAYHAE